MHREIHTRNAEKGGRIEVQVVRRARHSESKRRSGASGELVYAGVRRVVHIVSKPDGIVSIVERHSGCHGATIRDCLVDSACSTCDVLESFGVSIGAQGESEELCLNVDVPRFH